MRPTPIPDEEIWEGGHRLVVAPPGGDLTGEETGIEPVEAIVDVLAGPVRFCLRWVPEADDLERMAAGEPLWMILYAERLPPVALTLSEP